MSPLRAFSIYAVTTAVMTAVWFRLGGHPDIHGNVTSVVAFGTAMAFVRLGIVKR